MGNGIYQAVAGNSDGTPDTGQSVYVRMTLGSAAVQFVTSGSTYSSYTLAPLAQQITYISQYSYNLYIFAYNAWANRTPLSACSWSLTQGVPYEVCFALCALRSIDCWLCIPGWANTFTGLSAFWTSLATLAQSLLPSALRLFPEFTNEWWNLQQITRLCVVAGKQMFPSQTNSTTLGCEFYGSQVCQIADAFYAVYGATAYANQLTFSMGYPSGPNAGGAFNIGYSMNAPDWVALGNEAPYKHPYAKWQATGVGIDAMHFAPYWKQLSTADQTHLTGLSPQTAQLAAFFGLAYSGSYGGYTATGTTNGYVQDTINAISSTIASMKSYWPVSTNPWVTLPILGYEGGPNFAGGTSAWQTLYYAANRDARMGYCLFDPTNQLSANPGFLVSCITAGMQNWNYFSDIGSYTAAGAYGALESPNQTLSPLSAAPAKWAAIQNYIAA
jgi:hypothetical protein